MARSLLSFLVIVAAGCGGQSETSPQAEHSLVGTPCTTDTELRADFSGYRATEICVDDREEPDLFCVFNHFQGVPNCPYGMSEADLALPATDPRRCATPAGEPISVEVVPQLTQRRAHDVVHISCRCDGPDPQATYCACPAGFSCTHLIDDVGSGSTQYAGSYCIREGTAYDPDADYGPVCERSAAPGTAGHCD